MTLIGKQVIEKYMKSDPTSGSFLRPWVAEIEDANWKAPQEASGHYLSVDTISENRMLFRIGNNRHSLEVVVFFLGSIMKIDKVGSHVLDHVGTRIS